jgi:DNA-directed RNA polymerase subunit beta
LIGSLSTFARVNDYGFLETPYFVVKDGLVTKEVHYLSADEEDRYRIAPGDLRRDVKTGQILGARIPVRYRNEFVTSLPEEVDYVGSSPIQIVSVGTSLIPFLEHDDANRALMGANMQRQAVPLVNTQRPAVGTGLEKRVALDSGMCMQASVAGVVEKVSGDAVDVRETETGRVIRHKLMKYVRSNQDTCLNQRPIVRSGQTVTKGQVLADGASTKEGELSLGKNVLVAFMPWEGYNFEDAVLISERLVRDEVFSSIHIEKYEIDKINFLC